MKKDKPLTVEEYRALTKEAKVFVKEYGKSTDQPPTKEQYQRIGKVVGTIYGAKDWGSDNRYPQRARDIKPAGPSEAAKPKPKSRGKKPYLTHAQALRGLGAHFDLDPKAVKFWIRQQQLSGMIPDTGHDDQTTNPET